MFDAIHCFAALRDASYLTPLFVTCPINRSRIRICIERHFPPHLLSCLAEARSETSVNFGRPASKCQIASLELRKTNSLVLAPPFEAPDHRKHRQRIGLTHLPGVIGQECPPPRGFFDRSLDCTEIMIVRTR